MELNFYNTTSKTLLISLLYLGFVGCGATSLESDKLLTVEIYGVHRTPTDDLQAGGDASPRYMEMTFEDLVLVDSDGEEVSFTPETAVEMTVIDRPQIFVEEDLSDYEGTIFNSATISFAAAVKAAGKYSIAPYDLENNVLEYSQAMEVESGKGLAISIEIYWLKTVYQDDDNQDEVFLEPEFVISHSSN